MNYELQTISCIWFEILQYPACWTIHSPCILSSECRRLSGRYTVFLPAFSVFCLFLQCCRIAPAPAKVLTYAPIPGAVLYPVPDHSSYPAVLLPDRMSVYRFLCKPVFAILFLIYYIFYLWYWGCHSTLRSWFKLAWKQNYSSFCNPYF